MGNNALTISATDFKSKVSQSSPKLVQTETLNWLRVRSTSCFALPTKLGSREYLESDHERLQLRPYVVLIRTDGNTPLYYAYQHDDKNGESRSSGLWSIGIGDHVEEAVVAPKTIRDVLVESAIAKVASTTGFTIPKSSFSVALDNAALLHDTSNNVGKVHLAIVMAVAISFADLTKVNPEGGVQSWYSKQQLKTLNLENWSSIYTSQILP